LFMECPLKLLRHYLMVALAFGCYYIH